jgi:hypothetical protein
MSQGFGPLFDRAQRAYDNQEPPSEPHCACVHDDPYECARIRDGRHLPDDDDYHKRACECACHDDYEPEDL